MSDVTPPPAPTPPPAAPYAAAPAGPRTNTLAIVSLVLAFFVSLGAVICGHIALSQIKRTGENGRGLAIAGLILGYLGLVGGLIVAIVWVSFFTIAASTGGITFAP
jgi:peptidyl-prolyl cis-trans isomerase B (cyclophilin B)